MFSQSYLAERLVYLFLVGLIIFQYPVLSLFNVNWKLAGIPVLFLYLFGSWVVIIVLLMILMEFIRPDKHEKEELDQ